MFVMFVHVLDSSLKLLSTHKHDYKPSLPDVLKQYMAYTFVGK